MLRSKEFVGAYAGSIGKTLLFIEREARSLERGEVAINDLMQLTVHSSSLSFIKTSTFRCAS